MGVLVYEPNNSGGYWWLTGVDYHILEDAGWGVTWCHECDDIISPTIRRGASTLDEAKELCVSIHGNGDNWLGAVAGTAAKQFDEWHEGIEEWERLTGQSANDIGCPCCGPPHSWEWWNDDGTSKRITVNVPIQGELEVW